MSETRFNCGEARRGYAWSGCVWCGTAGCAKVGTFPFPRVGLCPSRFGWVRQGVACPGWLGTSLFLAARQGTARRGAALWGPVGQGAVGLGKDFPFPLVSLGPAGFGCVRHGVVSSGWVGHRFTAAWRGLVGRGVFRRGGVWQGRLGISFFSAVRLGPVWQGGVRQGWFWLGPVFLWRGRVGQGEVGPCLAGFGDVRRGKVGTSLFFGHGAAWQCAVGSGNARRGKVGTSNLNGDLRAPSVNAALRGGHLWREGQPEPPFALSNP